MKKTKRATLPNLPQATPFQDWEEGWIPVPDTKKGRRARRALVLKGRSEARRIGDKPEPIPRHVYVVEAENGLIKIGSAFDIELRFDQLHCASPVPLRLAWWHLNGGIKLERWLHQHYRHRRSHGEWFAVRVDEVKALVERWIQEGYLR